jgi:very-short-patch-repair endonuclease
MRQSEPEILLEHYLRELKLKYEREYRFHPTRLWRFDFALTDHRIGLEVEGGQWIGKGHTGGKHFESDIRKYNEATKMGWRIFRFTTNMVRRGEAKTFLKELFHARQRIAYLEGQVKR